MTTHTGRTPAPATGQTRDNTDVLALQAEASALITDLAVVLARVQVFWDRRPDDVLVGVYGPEARRARNDLVRLEKAERYDDTVRPLGQGFVRGTPSSTSASPAPAQTTAVSIFAEVTVTVGHHSRRMIRRLERAGVCPLLPALPANPTPGQRLSRLRRLIFICHSPGLLRDLVRDLEHVIDTATTYVEGPERTAMPDPCPHCGRRSLVLNIRTHTITCDRDPTTGEQRLCRCTDPYCKCAVNPFENRHQWHRARGAGPGGWWSLSDMQDRRVRNRLATLGVTARQVTTWAREQHLITESEANAADRIRHDLVDAYVTAHHLTEHDPTTEEPHS